MSCRFKPTHKKTTSMSRKALSADKYNEVSSIPRLTKTQHISRINKFHSKSTAAAPPTRKNSALRHDDVSLLLPSANIDLSTADPCSEQLTKYGAEENVLGGVLLSFWNIMYRMFKASALNLGSNVDDLNEAYLRSRSFSLGDLLRGDSFKNMSHVSETIYRFKGHPSSAGGKKSRLNRSVSQGSHQDSQDRPTGKFKENFSQGKEGAQKTKKKSYKLNVATSEESLAIHYKRLKERGSPVDAKRFRMVLNELQKELRENLRNACKERDVPRVAHQKSSGSMLYKPRPQSVLCKKRTTSSPLEKFVREHSNEIIEIAPKTDGGGSAKCAQSLWDTRPTEATMSLTMKSSL